MSASDSSEDAEGRFAARPLLPSALLDNQEQSDDESDSEQHGQHKQCAARSCGSTAAQLPLGSSASETKPSEETEGVILPSATDFDRLGDDSFLRVDQRLAEEPGWRLTPEQAASEARRAAEPRFGAMAPSSLPSYRYGRGLNLLQLGVQLSGRAAKRIHEPLAAALSAERQRQSSWQSCDASDAGRAGCEPKKPRENSRTRYEDI